MDSIWYKSWDHKGGVTEEMGQSSSLEWEFREREKHPKLGTVSKDEKLGISNHLLEDNSVNDKICLEPVVW